MNRLLTNSNISKLESISLYIFKCLINNCEKHAIRDSLNKEDLIYLSVDLANKLISNCSKKPKPPDYIEK